MVSLANEKVWTDKVLYDEAERSYYETLAKLHIPGSVKNEAGNKGEGMRLNCQVTVVNTNKDYNPSNNSTSSSKKSCKEKDKSKKVDNKVSNKETPSTVIQSLIVNQPTAAVESDKKVKDTLKGDGCMTKHNKNKDNQQKKLKSEKPVKEAVVNKKMSAEDNVTSCIPTQSSLASEVAKARQHIKNSLECMDSVAALAGVPNVELMNKLNSLERENVCLKKEVQDLRSLLLAIQSRVQALESKSTTTYSIKCNSTPAAPAQAPPAAAQKPDDDDDVDLFGSDDEEDNEEAARIREERLAAYNSKKAKKPVLIAKSNIILDVKPWDDETDMAEMEKAVRSISTDGLLWGAAKLVPLAYGIRKLQISCVVEDDKVSVDWLTEEIEKFENFVQSVDIAAFNKV